MELKDFDKELKDKLEARRISPAASSWEKLSEKLDNEQKKSTNYLRWTTIAAVFLGGILLGGVIFNPGKPTAEKSTKLVNEPVEKPIPEKPLQILEEIIIPTTNIASTQQSAPIAVQNNSVQKSKKNRQTKNPFLNSTKISSKPNKSVSEVILTEANFKPEEADKFPETSESSEIADNGHLEIDNLLNEAQRKIKNRPFLARPSNEIDAQALLESVETEGEQSAKDRIFNTVRDKLIQLASNNRLFN